MVLSQMLFLVLAGLLCFGAANKVPLLLISIDFLNIPSLFSLSLFLSFSLSTPFLLLFFFDSVTTKHLEEPLVFVLALFLLDVTLLLL